jgi:hypothetical protein
MPEKIKMDRQAHETGIRQIRNLAEHYDVGALSREFHYF